MAVNVSIQTTAGQDAKLERIRRQQDPVPDTVNAMARQFLIDRLLGEISQLDHADDLHLDATVKAAYIAATPEVQAQVRTILGVTT